MLTHHWPSGGTPARVSIIGAAGFVGGAIKRQAEAAGFAVLPIARSEVDLLAGYAAEKLAALLRADDVVVAASAIAPVKNAQMLKDNVTLIDAIAAALKLRPVAQVINIGSDAIYADSETPLDEASPREPTGLHGIMHYFREVMLAEAAGAAPFATLRPTLIYGADDPHNGYGPNRFRGLAAKGETITLFGEGEERRDHVYVEDVAELAVRMIRHRSSGALNAVTGSVVSFRDVARMVAGLFDSPPSIVGSPRSGPMPHNGYRPFNAAATKQAFPDFTYVQPADGFAKVHAQVLAITRRRT